MIQGRSVCSSGVVEIFHLDLLVTPPWDSLLAEITLLSSHPNTTVDLQIGPCGFNQLDFWAADTLRRRHKNPSIPLSCVTSEQKQALDPFANLESSLASLRAATTLVLILC